MGLLSSTDSNIGSSAAREGRGAGILEVEGPKGVRGKDIVFLGADAGLSSGVVVVVVLFKLRSL
jgi:hypothetical protein